METPLLSSLKQLSDAELVARVQALAARERGATALLVAHLADLDTRDVLLREGYSSLFAYCREALGLSDHEALNRIEAARAARRFPAIVEMLTVGTVHLTAVRLLAPHLTTENHQRVLAEARGKRTEEIRAMAAALAAPAVTRFAAGAPPMAGGPAPEFPLAPASAPAPPSPSVLLKATESAGARALSGATPAGAVRGGPASQGVAPVLAPYRRPVMIAGQTIEKLHLAKEMLRHANPTGDEDAIVDRALTLLLAGLARKTFADTDRPREGRGARPGSRYIPAHVRRAVWVRDLGRCAYVSASGHRCSERGFLQFHHVKPHEVGGPPTVENIQLRCGRHNRYEAKVYFRREEGYGEGVVSERRIGYGALERLAEVNSF